MSYDVPDYDAFLKTEQAAAVTQRIRELEAHHFDLIVNHREIEAEFVFHKGKPTEGPAQDQMGLLEQQIEQVTLRLGALNELKESLTEQ